MLRFQCPSCRSVLQVSGDRVGTVVRCGQCQQPLRVPAPVVAPSSANTASSGAEASRRSAGARKRVPPSLSSSGRANRGAVPGRKRAEGERGRRAAWIALVVSGILILVGIGVGVLLREGPPSTSREGSKLSGLSKKELAGSPGAVSPEEPAEEKPVELGGLATKKEEEENRLRKRVLDLINRQRAEEGIAALRLEEQRSRDCKQHASYLGAHRDQAELDLHQQDLQDPLSSEGGRRAARVGSIRFVAPREALQGWLLAPAHRSMLLDRELESIGIGFEQDEAGRWVSVFDFQSGKRRGKGEEGEGRPVLYPGRGQEDVPLHFPGNEIPDPIPEAKDKRAGYPVTVHFPPGSIVSSARAWFEDENGQEVPFWFSSPSRPANKEHVRTQQNTVCLIAQQMLKPGMRYVVRVEARLGEENWEQTWSFTTESPRERSERMYERALRQLNRFREAAGLKPVVADGDLQRACRAHADYLARHLDRVANLRVNDEDSALEGYTEKGKAIASRSMIRLGGGAGPVDATEWLMASVLNRHLALNPSLKTVGMGAALQAPRGWIWVIHLPGARLDGERSGAVLYPGKNQQEIPLGFGREIASLVPGQPKQSSAGYAITANFFPRDRVQAVVARLEDAEGKEVACWLSTPEKPLSGTGSYQQILLVPKQRLRSGSRYTVSMEARVNGRSWSEKWTFTTKDHQQYEEQIGKALQDQINAIRKRIGLTPVSLEEKLSKGCKLHANYLVQNLEHPKVQGLGIHEEEPTLLGASSEGAKAGNAAVIAVISDPMDSVEGWMATLYHRIPLLNPRLKRIGYGQAEHPLRGWITVLDATRGQ